MKKIEVNIPDRVYEVAQQAIADGYFGSMDDLIRISVMNYVRRPVLDQLERQQLDDIETARRQS